MADLDGKTLMDLPALIELDGSEQVYVTKNDTDYRAAAQLIGSADVTEAAVLSALGYTPYNAATNPSNFITTSGARAAVSGSSTVTYSVGTGVFSLVSGNVTTALGFTPYNATNPAGYITVADVRGEFSALAPLAYDSGTGVTSVAPMAAGTVLANNTGGSAAPTAVTYVTLKTALALDNVENKSSVTIRSEITSGNVTTALGFTPYSAANPSSYITTSGARAAVAGSSTISYDGGTGVFSLTSGNIGTALGYTPSSVAALAAAGGSALVGFQAAGSTKLETIQTKLRERVVVTSFMYVVDASASTGIQRALDYVKANGGGTIYFPSDVTYTCVVPLVYSAAVPIRFEGGGGVPATTIASSLNQTILNYTGAAGTGPFLLAETSSAIAAIALSGFEIENLQLTTANQTKASGGIGLCLRGVNQFRIVNVHIAGFATGFLTDDNPSNLASGGTRCGYGFIQDLRVTRAAKVRVDLRASASIKFQDLHLSYEDIAGYDADMIIQNGTRGLSTDGCQIDTGTMIGQNSPPYNLRILGDSFFINIDSVAFENSSTCAVDINYPGILYNNTTMVSLNNCWWNGHTGMSLDVLNARVFVNNPRMAGLNNTLTGTQAVRFRGSASPSQPTVGGGICGGIIDYRSTYGVLIDNAKGVKISQVEFHTATGGSSGSVRLGANAVSCYVTLCPLLGSTPGVSDAGSLNTILSNSGLKINGGPSVGIRKYTGTLDGSGAAIFAHGLTAPTGNVMSVRARYTDAIGVVFPMTWTYVDGANIGISGGGASRPYVAYLDLDGYG